MITQLCANFFQEWGILIILVVFLIFMLVFSASKRKKDAQMAEDFANNLKVGDKIKTYSGIYGKIISIKDTPSGKVATIETGEGKNVSYMTVDVYAIYNIETPVNEKKAGDNKVEEIKEEVVTNNEVVEEGNESEVLDAVVAPTEVEEKKPSTKKTSSKKGTTKSKQKNEDKTEFDKMKEEENK